MTNAEFKNILDESLEMAETLTSEAKQLTDEQLEGMHATIYNTLEMVASMIEGKELIYKPKKNKEGRLWNKKIY